MSSYLPYLLAGTLALSAITGLRGEAQPSTIQTSVIQTPAIGQIQAPGVTLEGQQASITGTIRNEGKFPVAGVTVQLAGDNAVARKVVSDSKGTFTFDNLAAGTYHLIIAEPGLKSSVSALVVLAPGEKYSVPEATTEVAVYSTSVNVVATPNQIADAQVKELVQQRVFGFVPNYYTSFIWDAAPMTPSLKFRLALRTAIDPMTFVVAAGIAGAEQAHKTFPAYGQGSEGYAKRFGATYADTLSNRIFGSAIFPVIFHQDPRYFYRGSGTVQSRVLYAVVSTFVCRADNGHLEPNYSRVLGSFAAAGLSNVYRAPADRQVGLTFRNGLIITASAAVVNVLQELFSRKLTSNVPAFANGKP